MEQIQTQTSKIVILSSEDVINLHTLLSTNYHTLVNMDPVQPAGIKDYNLLCSAVNRQNTGLNDWYKYDTIFNSCATLLFGMIKNHCFHNGNKRTALLCMIKHLYHNGYVLAPNLRHEEIYEFLLSIAQNTLDSFIDNNRNYRKWEKNNKLNKTKLSNENEIHFISYWLKQNTKSKVVQIKNKVKISHLRSILNGKNIKLEQNGAIIRIFKEEKRSFLLIKLPNKVSFERTYSLGNSINEVNLAVLTSIRRDFNLTQQDGVDNITFYDDESFLDEEVTNYRKIIYKLSKN